MSLEQNGSGKLSGLGHNLNNTSPDPGLFTVVDIDFGKCFLAGINDI